MGTRHLTCVFFEGEYKIAQYGQWDGYPTGQGMRVLRFLKRFDRDKFLANLKTVKVVTPKEVAKLWVECGADPKKEFVSLEIANAFGLKYPSLSRDTGADILQLIEEQANVPVELDLDFAADSLFCEWAWVIDFDKNTLEGYRGFNTSPVPEGERFAKLKPYKRDVELGKQYYPIRHIATLDLSNLPDGETFVSIFSDKDEDNDE